MAGGQMAQTRRPSGGLEAEVLATLTAATKPMTAAEVRSALGNRLAYTTIMTVLSRIASKGLAVKQRRGRADIYTPVRDPAEIAAMRMRRLLESEHDRAAVLVRFVGALSGDDERLLLDLLATPQSDPPG
jgi:predicted transcriptional regulator